MADCRLVADAGCILSDVTLDWMIANPGIVVKSPIGDAAAVVVDGGSEIDLASLRDDSGCAELGLRRASDADLSAMYNRKLRRQQDGLVLDVDAMPVAAAEWRLFKDVYKGITDIVTRYVWPVPAFWLVRLLSRIGVTPNAVTMTSIVLTFVTAYLFFEGMIGEGLILAWTMTFLDTVDGKLARVTCTSSPFGNKLDHIPDLVHPPVWWGCLAYGLLRDSADHALIVGSAVVIVGSYVVGRLVEVGFKKVYGFNQYMWQPFDQYLRLIIARRNTILAIMTVGLILGQPVAGFVLAAVWSVLTIGIQPIRFIQAWGMARGGSAPTPWIQ
ncbi:CDP-alcohol phosphatidyltransferase family protein [Croceicoccus naphthovorans]|nr:CDP-alcohol phosphatidyltransferase family protein [Croceicoccus naphthovorans]